MRKVWEVFRFEVAYQARRVSTWLYPAVLLGFTILLATQAYIGKARSGGYYFNGPFVVAEVTLVGSVLGLLLTTGLAGDAAGRDVATRMAPLVYTTPVGASAYLGGRFLAAFVLNALILVAVPAGLLIAALPVASEAGLVGPFRPAAYAGAYLLLAVPNAFVGTALSFSAATLSRRAVASYLGSVLLVFAAVLNWQLVAGRWGRWELATLLDPLGLTALSERSRVWTPSDKNTRLIGAAGSLAANRLAWLGVAAGALALTYRRFRFAHHAPRVEWGRGAWRRSAPSPTTGAAVPAAPAPYAASSTPSAPVAAPRNQRSFGFSAHVHQALAVTWASFRTIVTSGGGLVLAAVAGLLVLTGPQVMQHMGVPLRPTTQQVTALLAAPLTDPQDLVWMVVPLFIVFYAGELVWRERDARLSDIADAAPVPEWVPLLGKFVGLGLALVSLQALLLVAGTLIQASLGYHTFELGLYGRVLFGLQLADYLLFALLALAVHVLVNHKYLGHLVVLVAYAFMAFAPALGVEHRLLVYGSDPGWTYSDMRGFGPFLGPWAWFKLYWAAWALLLAVAARLLWVRGREQDLGARLRLARGRCTRPAAATAASASGLVLALGGFVFYNTNVLNAYRSTADRADLRAAYERRYGRYAGVPQPRLVGTSLRVEFFPARRAAEVRGAYRLVNASAAAIDAVHLATAPDVETGAVTFDRPATRVLADDVLGHRIYALAQPLRPGDSLRLSFVVRVAPRGFSSREIDASVSANGTYVAAEQWLPAVGYQRSRELGDAGDRRTHGLRPHPAVRSLHDAAAREDVTGAERIAFDAVVGTDAGQVAVAPGALRRTWSEGGRRYFQYATDAPIPNDYALYSAVYAVRERRWRDPAGREVAIQIVHHPGHAWNVDRMAQSVRASLDTYSQQFGPYPHGQLRLVEHPGAGNSLHAAPINIAYEEGFALFDPARDPRALDFPFAVVAHEVAHQWWGNQVTPADVEGGRLVTEGLAWYSAMQVVERTYGREHLRRLLAAMREAYASPRARAGVPLLRATEYFDAYRKGPFAMYALREYVGEARVNAALRRLLAQHGAGAPPRPTSLDLYRALQAATPDSLRPLLADLFERNTYWELAATRVAAEPAATGAWRVTLDVWARKVAVDTAGAETELPMNDLVEVGVFAATQDAGLGEPLYLRLHRVHAGAQRITVTVPRTPAQAGIDPRNLLIDVKADDHRKGVTRVDAPALRSRADAPPS